jgi:hypothetical protein
MAKRDVLQSAKDDYSDAKDAVREQYERIRDDFRFSNPAEPEQWDSWAKTARAGRPMHTLDRTNQYVQHVVNKHRASKTSADVFPVDGGADVDVAKKLKGIIRHIEYVSKADIAWDTASDHQARGGLGWIRVLPKIANGETNEQDIIIQRVHDPLSCLLDPNSTEPDGSDAMFGFCETTVTDTAFKRLYPKAKKDSFDSEGWFGDDAIRIAEYFRVVETNGKKLTIVMPDGQKMLVTEDEYMALSQSIGYMPNVEQDAKGNPAWTITTSRKVMWSKMTGSEILEETEFPSQWIGIVPVLGHELWVDNKRFLCGLVRRLRDGQKLHNFEMSALTEALMVQPKAPFMVDERGIVGHEDEWQQLNKGNPAYITYNGVDEQGQPVNAPIRLSPPNFPVAYANSANLAVLEMEASIGMYKASMGQQSNAISGRAKLADKEAGDTATFHFADNRRVAQEQVYRIVVDMIPRVYDGTRQAKILGEDGQSSTIAIDPRLPDAKQMEGGKIVAINPGVGRYDVRVKIGASYATIRDEMATKLQELGKGNPVLAAALTPILMKLADMPEADKVARIAMAMLPPEVQKAYNEEDNADMPPAAKSQIAQQGQQIQQMADAMDQASKVIKDLQGQLDEKNTKVQDEAGKAIAEIKAAQAGLKAQADAIAAQQKELEDAKTIASLEIQLQAAQAQQDSADNAEPADTTPQPAQPPMQLVIPSNDEALKALSESVAKSQEALANVIAQNTQTIAQLQSLTVDAIEDMADAIAAPRDIKLQRGADGRTTGATSVAVMPAEEPGEATETEQD